MARVRIRKHVGGEHVQHLVLSLLLLLLLRWVLVRLRGLLRL